MKYISFLFLFISLPVLSQSNVSLSEVKQAGLHVIEITTNNGEEPEGTIIESPYKPGTYNMTYANKVPCRIVISLDDMILFDSGIYEKKVSGATIRINGNTSAYYSDPLNMPYKIKLEKEADLLCRRNDDFFSDKHWRLLKDAVSMNTIIGLKVSELIDMEWTAAYIPCNVVINGDYRGCYLLIETVKRNNKCRINCDKNTGCIVERDPYWWKENHFFSSQWYSDDSMYRWTWNYPDEDELDEERESYIQQYINHMENSLESGNYNDYINIISWTKWILAHDILGTRDSGGANMFIKKQDNSNNSLLEMPCIWDFDSSYDVTPGNYSRLHTSSHAYFNQLFNSNNISFSKQYLNLWKSKKDYLINQLISFINDFVNSDRAVSLNVSRKLHNKRWNTTYSTIEKDAQQALLWFDSHITKLDKNIQSIDNILTEIENKSFNNNNSKDTQYFTIDGRNKKSLQKGNIIIERKPNKRNSKKYILK